MVNKILTYIKHPSNILLFLDSHKIIKLSDEHYLKIVYKQRMGKKLNLKNPVTFDEKLQWLKIHDRKELYTTMVDKYEVKKYVSKIIGDKYIIPTLGIYDKWDDINFGELPNQFVIKCTHDSGGLIICKDKNNFDKNSAKIKINECLKKNFYDYVREWPYKNVKPRILIEKYMEDKTDGELRDYKFYCFDGYIKALLLATNRQNKEKELCFDYFDENFNHLNLTNHWHPNAINVPHKPLNFEKMKELAKKLSKGFVHLRVDFYEVNGKVFFGELTFFDNGGFLRIHPDTWEKEWGNLIDLEKINTKDNLKLSKIKKEEEKYEE